MRAGTAVGMAATEERNSRTSCWRQGDYPRFLSLPGSSEAAVAPSFLPAPLTGSVLESVSLNTGLLRTGNRVNTAAGSDRSIFPHGGSDRFTQTRGDSCLRQAEPHSQKGGAGGAEWDK